MNKLTKEKKQLLHSFRHMNEREQIKIIGIAEERLLYSILRDLPQDNEQLITALIGMLDESDLNHILYYTRENKKERCHLQLIEH